LLASLLIFQLFSQKIKDKADNLPIMGAVKKTLIWTGALFLVVAGGTAVKYFAPPQPYIQKSAENPAAKVRMANKLESGTAAALEDLLEGKGNSWHGEVISNLVAVGNLDDPSGYPALTLSDDGLIVVRSVVTTSLSGKDYEKIFVYRDEKAVKCQLIAEDHENMLALVYAPTGKAPGTRIKLYDGELQGKEAELIFGLVNSYTRNAKVAETGLDIMINKNSVVRNAFRLTKDEPTELVVPYGFVTIDGCLAGIIAGGQNYETNGKMNTDILALPNDALRNLLRQAIDNSK
jgi:hypothetical protein